jgi:hypothetical protein
MITKSFYGEYRREQAGKQSGSRFFKIALVLVRLDHIASFIVNANH